MLCLKCQSSSSSLCRPQSSPSPAIRATRPIIAIIAILFAGATAANLQQQHTEAMLSWPASSRPVAVPWHDTHPTARRLVRCRLRHHSCCRCYARPSTAAAAAARWPRLIRVAAAAAACTRGIRKLPTVIGHRAVSLQNNPLITIRRL